jgi:pimeloyl-ACP methyl ester carboxylesterase
VIHRQWFGAEPPSSWLTADRVPIVLLHEGLGSVSAWGRFPAALAATTGRPVLAYDRDGYGRSGPRPGPWPADFMHRDARRLAALLAGEGIERTILAGHSDGATVALLYPSQAGPGAPAVAGIVSLSAHVLVEEAGVEAIEVLRRTYASRLRPRLARHHRDADAVFAAWSEVWVSERFRPWTIDAELGAVRCPVLAIQGDTDTYGTRQQLDRLEAGVAGKIDVHELAGVDHWPHREATGQVLDLITTFCHQLGT